MVRFDFGSLFQGQISVAKFKCAYNISIITPRGLQCETNLQVIMDLESSDVVRFDQIMDSQHLIALSLHC